LIRDFAIRPSLDELIKHPFLDENYQNEHLKETLDYISKIIDKDLNISHIKDCPDEDDNP
jgi:hypothetical protein